MHCSPSTYQLNCLNFAVTKMGLCFVYNVFFIAVDYKI